MEKNGLIDLTIGEFLDKTAEKFPEKDALVFPNKNLRYTWKELKAICDKTAKGFLKLKIKKGDHVAVWATNYPEWVISQFALAKIGAVLVTVNLALKTSEIEYVLRQSDSKTLILVESFKSSDYVSMLQEVCPEIKDSQPGKLRSKKLPKLKNIILIGDKRLPGMFNFQEVVEMGKNVSDRELAKREKSLESHDIINVQYTSGTTGFPKGAMLSHFNILNNAIFIAQNMKLTERDRICIPVPFYHCFGCVMGNLCSLATGAAMVVPSEYFDAQKTLEAIEKEKCTAVYGVPTMFIAELNHFDFERFNLSSLRTGMMAGAPCPIELARDVIDKMGAREMTILYGLTEASPGLTQTKSDDSIERRVSTVGKALPYVKIKIVNPETGKKVSYGVQGELLAQGYNVMKGYYNMPHATRETIDRDGWLRSGDLAEVDGAGYYKITGRLKDMIIRGGENIYPKEIEEFLFRHPKIADVQVVGVPSEKFGEEVAACIKIKQGEKLTEDEVRKFCQGKIAHYKIPRHIVFMDKFPTTVTGKIQKFRLKEMLIKKLGLKSG